MKKLIFLSIAGLFGLTTANAQYTERTVYGKYEGTTTTHKPDGTVITTTNCEPFFQNMICYVEKVWGARQGHYLARLTTFENNTISSVIEIENLQDIKETGNSNGVTQTMYISKPEGGKEN